MSSKRLNKLSAVFRALLALVFVVPATLLCVVLVITGKGGKSSRIVKTWARTLLLLAGGRVEVYGRQNLSMSENYVFIANHQSIFDIPALMGYLPMPFFWLAKKELFALPFMGKAMKGIGSIPVDRRDKKSAIRSLTQALDRLHGGHSIMIFPEGTRSKDGQVHEFKPGAFFLAVKSKKPVVPVAVIGTDKMMPRRSFSLYPSRMIVVITPPIQTTGRFAGKEELARVTRNRIIMVREQYGEHPKIQQLSA